MLKPTFLKIVHVVHFYLIPFVANLADHEEILIYTDKSMLSSKLV